MKTKARSTKHLHFQNLYFRSSHAARGTEVEFHEYYHLSSVHHVMYFLKTGHEYTSTQKYTRM
jgi:hypothetical protein